jgi:hypothetical protein
MTINGLTVVRRPHLNYLVPQRDIIPCVNDVYYAGVDRQRWADVFDEDFYARKSPTQVIRFASSLRARNNDFTGIDLCQDEGTAIEMLDYANRTSNNNELIAVRSSSLTASKGTLESGLPVEWMGFDFVALGDWSLIAAGMFTCPQRYSTWLARANRFGLFDDSSLLAEYVSAYEQAVEAGQSEPIAPSTAGFEKVAIEVGRVHILDEQDTSQADRLR